MQVIAAMPFGGASVGMMLISLLAIGPLVVMLRRMIELEIKKNM